MQHRYHHSALLDAIHYLSAKSSCNHTVVAWTGEIFHGPDKNDDVKPDHPPPVVPTSTFIPLGGNANYETPKSKNVSITRDDQKRLERKLYDNDIRIVPVWLADEKEVTEDGIKLCDQSRWRRYAEHDLCALLHYKQHPPSEGYTEAARWADYCRMNHLFAEKILEVYKPGDVVLVHDYSLMLLPQLLREKHSDISIAFFLHTPFPSSELIRCLARRKDILEGMLGSDLIAVQSFHYAQHIANSCTRILELEATSNAVKTKTRNVQLAVIPVGINVSNINSLAWTESITEKCSVLRNKYSGKKIIVAYDPTDRLGGVDKKLLAFDRFLEVYPDWQDRVVLLQVISQAAIDQDDADQSTYSSTINGLVTEINRKYGSLDHLPVLLHSQNFTIDEYFALLRSGDLALFTSIRDGMSTTSLEYVVCQQDAHGPIIISEFSGAANNLEEAIHINPWDTVDVADQIHQALNMSDEKRQSMHAALAKRITEYDVGYWVTTVLRRLMKAIGSERRTKYVAVNGLPVLSEEE